MKKIINSIKHSLHENPQAMITCFVFLIMVFGITIASMVNPIRTFSENENRYLAQIPEFSKEALISGKFTEDYEKFLTDQFVGRDKWISVKTLTERAMLKQDINGVYIGKEGYLIEKHNDSDMDKEQIAKNQERLSEFIAKYSALLGEKHVKALIVPTASEILTDKLPPFATGFNQNEMIEEIKTELEKNGSCFVDVRETLKNHKDESIYYKTDHHWTSLGAYYAYEEWAKLSGFTPLKKEEFNIEKVTDSFYGTIYSKLNMKVVPDSINLYKIKEDIKYNLTYNQGEKTTETLYDMEKLEGKDKYSVFLGGNNAIVQINTNQKNGRRLLVVKDSFAHSFVPFAVNHFEQTFMVDFRYFKMGISQYIEENNITDILVLYNTINLAKDKNTSAFVR